ncbi:E3 ubiquitin-protein ligase RNF213-like, partial [Saccostrea cucullata]
MLKVFLFIQILCIRRQMFLLWYTLGTQEDFYPKNLLQSTGERDQWETEVSTTIIEPIVKEMDRSLASMIDLILNDEKMNFLDPLYRLINEIDVASLETTGAPLHENSRAWRYRPQITLEYLMNVILGKIPEHKYPTLFAFIQQENILRYIHFVPNILRLQRLLQKKFQRKIDRDELKTMTISMIIDMFED